MLDQNIFKNVAPDVIAAHPNNDSGAGTDVPPFSDYNDTNDDAAHALVGKIARLPKDIRDQLNRRLENGNPAFEILPWLNELPIVKSILARHFAGVPLNSQNLSNWRQGGYRRWLEKQKPLALLKEITEDAADISRVGRPTIAHAAATILSSQILTLLQTVSDKKLSAAELAKTAQAITALINSQHNNIRLQHEKTRICQRDDEILLKRDKHQRDVTAIGLRLLGDARAKDIEASTVSYGEKIELLGRYTFGDHWRHRPVPSQPKPNDPSLTASIPQGESSLIKPNQG